MLLVTKRPTPLFLLFHEKWYISIVDSFLNMLNWSRWANWKTPYPEWGSNEYINSYILAPYDRNVPVDSFSIRQTRLVIIWQAYLWSHNSRHQTIHVWQVYVIQTVSLRSLNDGYHHLDIYSSFFKRVSRARIMAKSKQDAVELLHALSSHLLQWLEFTDGAVRSNVPYIS